VIADVFEKQVFSERCGPLISTARNQQVAALFAWGLLERLRSNAIGTYEPETCSCCALTAPPVRELIAGQVTTEGSGMCWGCHRTSGLRRNTHKLPFLTLFYQ
jgi:hypothetical protein